MRVLAVLLKVLGATLLALVVGWFGYQVYIHLTDARRADERLQQVSQAWEDDPASLAAAAGGQAVTPAALRDDPFQAMGAETASAYRVEGGRLLLAITPSGCITPVYGVDLRRTGETLVVLVRPQTSWLPDPDDAWRSLTGGSVSCAAVGPTQVWVAVEEDPGDLLVIDAVTGASVPRAS